MEQTRHSPSIKVSKIPFWISGCDIHLRIHACSHSKHVWETLVRSPFWVAWKEVFLVTYVFLHHTDVRPEPPTTFPSVEHSS